MEKITMKKGTKLLTLITASVLGLSAFAGCGAKKTETDLTGYVALDVNPSIELLTDANGKVTEVRAANKDAKILLSDLNLTGLKLSAAVEIITESCEEVGYINDQNKDVSITVAGETKKAEDKLTDLAEKGVADGSVKAEISVGSIVASLEVEVEKIKASDPELYKNLTVEKLRIINSIMEYDRSFTVEMGVNLKVKELAEILEEYVEEFEDFFEDEIEIAFEEKMNEIAGTLYSQIDAFYNQFDAEFSALSEKLRKLEILEEKFEMELEEAQNQVGEFKFNFDRDFDDDDEENEVLTAEMKTKLTEIIGANNITTLDELDDYIDGIEDRVENVIENANLSAEIQAQIDQVKVQIEACKVQAKQAISSLIELAKTELQAKKEFLKTQNALLGNN